MSSWIVQVAVPYEGGTEHYCCSADEAADFIKFHYMPGWDYDITVRPATKEYEKMEFLNAVEAGEVE